MGVFGRLTGAAMGAALGLQAATQFVAWSFSFAPLLGRGVSAGPETVFYPPWAVLIWRTRFGAEEPGLFSGATALILLGFTLGLSGAVVLGGEAASRRIPGWGGRAAARKAGLLARNGCVIGDLNGRLL